MQASAPSTPRMAAVDQFAGSKLVDELVPNKFENIAPVISIATAKPNNTQPVTIGTAQTD